MNLSQVEYMIDNSAESAMSWLASMSTDYFSITLTSIVSLFLLIGIAPTVNTGKTTNSELVFITLRQCLWFALIFLAITVLVMTALNIIAYQHHLSFATFRNSLAWYGQLLLAQWPLSLSMVLGAITLRFVWFRWAKPTLSNVVYHRRKLLSTDTPSDITQEIQTYTQKDFTPSQYYSETGLFIGLNEHRQPDYIPLSTWREVNAQIIGPSRYGKGVLLGCLMDQITQKGDGLIYVDPKNDHWAPHILYQAARKAHRKFYYLTLHDEGPGAWAPFAGGTLREGLARLETAFGLDYTGNAGTDFYKSQEKAELEAAMKTTRSIEGLQAYLKDNEQTLRINAELKRWFEIQSLCPAQDQAQFSVEQAIRENAVVYVQGSLDDPIVTTATKVLITEYVQVARALFKQKQRDHYLTMIIDEVSFLASETLAKALATGVGFNVNFVLAYQSPSDLLNVDDKTVNPRYLLQSITINSQVKITYGGTDKDAAELVSKLSGTTTKSLTRSESTDTDTLTGGEIWHGGRSVMQQEVPLIHVNTMYALPPRVCAFFQPRSLAQIRYTSHVPVDDLNALPDYLQAFFGPMQTSNTLRQSNLTEEELALIATAQDKAPKPQKKQATAKTNTDRMFEGTVLNFGYAPYNHVKGNTPSFYITLQLTSGDSKTIWSFDLKRAIAESKASQGDHITLEYLGKVPAMTEEKVTLADGSVESKSVENLRSTWCIHRLNRAETKTLSVDSETDEAVKIQRKSRRKGQKQKKRESLT